MRSKRVDRFRRVRHNTIKRFIFYAVVLPSTSVFLGYLITSLFILPSMHK